MRSVAPWSPDIVARLNRWQDRDMSHPFTCPGRPDCPKRELVATGAGWICACGDYRQGWAHAGMTEHEPPTQDDLLKGLAQ